MFKNIEINNFRALKQIKVDDFKQFNLIVGENNCGKTSLLEALYLSINPVNSALPGKINNWRGLDPFDVNIWKSIFYRYNTDLEISINSETSAPIENRHIKIKPRKVPDMLKTSFVEDFTQSDVNLIEESSSTFKTYINGVIINFYYYDSKGKKSPDYSSLIYLKEEFLSADVKTLIGKQIEPFHIEIDTKYKATTDGRFSSSATLFSGFNKRFGELIRKKAVSPLINILKKVDLHLKDIVLIGNKIFVDLDFDELAPLNIMGDGFLNFFALLLNTINTENGILLIDEVQNGIYYKKQELLWDVIFDIAEQYNIQIFATTHSFDCVQAFHNSYVKRNLEDDKLRLYRIERNDNDNYLVTKYNQKELNVYIENEWEIR